VDSLLAVGVRCSALPSNDVTLHLALVKGPGIPSILNKNKEMSLRLLKDITSLLGRHLVLIKCSRIYSECMIGIPVFGTSALSSPVSPFSLSFLWLFVDLLFKFMKRPSQRKEREMSCSRDWDQLLT
jgi:hypothetical protein